MNLGKLSKIVGVIFLLLAALGISALGLSIGWAGLFLYFLPDVIA